MDLKLLLAFLTGMIVLLYFGAVAYVVWDHPAAAGPLETAATVVGPPIAVLALIVALKK